MSQPKHPPRNSKSLIPLECFTAQCMSKYGPAPVWQTIPMGLPRGGSWAMICEATDETKTQFWPVVTSGGRVLEKDGQVSTFGLESLAMKFTVIDEETKFPPLSDCVPHHL